MRFLADGPSIPDELLLARDQGRVIFFCGAGVSRACAELPDFFGLAREVIDKLVIDKNDPSYKLMQEAGKIEGNVGIPGIISADSIFGYLERDFDTRDIEEAVATALKPKANCNLTAHEILLDLATTPEGNVQLVTTNFDRLFDKCGRNLHVWQPPRLPNPSLPNEINGIIYLHGRSTPNYKAAENGGFVLSSSDFGRAYLSDGWATNFIRGIFQNYVVVFVGYSADDPPVRYLLEALHKTSGNKINAYAFQSGDYDDAVTRWQHKGVEAIPYSPDDGHKALWKSLEPWAERARDPDAWVEKVINACQNGPTVLQPHERVRWHILFQPMKAPRGSARRKMFPLPNGFVCSTNTDASPSRIIQPYLLLTMMEPILIHSIYMALIQTIGLLNQIPKKIMPSPNYLPLRGTLSNLTVSIK